MNVNGPGSVRKVVIFLIFFVLISLARSQHESHEGTNGKNHLHGIRKLWIQRLTEAKPFQKNSDARRRFFSSSAKATDPDEPSWPWWPAAKKPRAPTAVIPVMDSHEEIKQKKRVNLFQVHAAPTQVITQNQETELPKALKVQKIPQVVQPSQDVQPSQFRPFTQVPQTLDISQIRGRPEIKELTNTVTREEMEQKRQERILARWKKLGLLRDNGRNLYNRMKFVHFAQPIAWKHGSSADQSTTPPPVTVPRIITEAPKSPNTVVAVKTTTEASQTQPISKPFWHEVFKPTTEEPMIRRINKHPIHVETPNSVFGRRAFGKQTLFNGPILGNEEVPEVPPSKPITASTDSFGDDTDGPTIEDTSKNDYHSRSSSGRTSPVKRFKLTNKITNRPRLKIRRPEEQFAARGDHNEKSYPLAIPELAPLGSSESRRPLPSRNFEEAGPFMTRHRIATDSGITPLQGLRPLPLGEQNIQVEPPQPPQQKKPPPVTDWGDSEDFSESITEESGIIGSGSGFGGDIGTPPPGFKESFGLNGANMELTTAAPTTVRTTTRRTTIPPPEEPFVVPENSGLRPVAPPREFIGGFGSSRGSSLSGFGGPSPFAGVPQPLPSAGPPPQQKISGNKKPRPEPELKEEDFFTGDSALTPNRRGPSGDGFGPPVFVGAPAPPPVPAVGLGGAAAGIPPMVYHRTVMNENEATTVKPSALLSILTKADEGFNQAITHFEQGTPIESAAIDILEVALGSERLDSQAKLLGHVDRTIGLDNLQRLQRWANTGGAFDMVKEQLAKFAKNYKVPEPTVTIPPQLEYLFAPSG